MKKCIVALFGLLAWFQPLSAQTNIRLAILPEDSALAVASDGLTARFAGQEHVELLEREQIKKIYQEQALSPGRQDSIKLGQLLGADGLLILRLVNENDRPALSVRLVAVKPGITLAQHQYPWPLEEPDSWSSLVLSQFESLLPKLSVLPEDAVPVSILNLHSTLASVDSEILEHELTELLYDRLVREKKLFVLERRRLESLQEEKELNDSAESPFWNGSFLLQGAIDQAGFDRERVTIDLQLTPKNRQGLISLNVTGPRTNLPAVIENLAQKILAAIQVGAAGESWDTAAEASRYVAEAKWTLKWRLFEEAKAASETAWALGVHTPELAEQRIKACLGAAGGPGFCVVEKDGHVTFGIPLFSRIIDFGQLAAYASSPKPERFHDAIHAADIYSTALRQFSGATAPAAPTWLALGKQVLETNSLWLRYYYFTPEARTDEEDAIEETKKLCREISSGIAADTNLLRADTNHGFALVEAEHSAFWHDTPEEGLTTCRELVARGEWPFVRSRYFKASGFQLYISWAEPGWSSDPIRRFENGVQGHFANAANPCLAGWKWEDRQRWPKVWAGFIAELCNSTDPLIVLEGRLMRLSWSWSEEEFADNLEKLILHVEQHEQSIADAGLGERIVKEMEVLMEMRDYTFFSPEENVRIKEQLWKNFQTRFHDFLKQNTIRAQELQKQSKHQAILVQAENYLKKQTNFDFTFFAQNVLQQEYTPAEAKDMLPLLTNYLKVLNSSPTAGTNQMRIAMDRLNLQQAEFWINRAEQKLSDVISPPPANAAAGKPSTNFAASPVASNLPPAILRPITNGIVINRFWTVPPTVETEAGTAGRDFPGATAGLAALGGVNNFRRGRALPPEVASACYREGKLWLEIRRGSSSFGGHSDFFGVDLGTFASEPVPFTDQEVALPDQFKEISGRRFEVFQGYFYLTLGGSISRYSLAKKTWETFPLPAGGDARIIRLEDHLFCITANSVLECGADGSFQVVASNRRQPQLSPLDAVENYDSLNLFATRDHVIHAHAGSGVYSLAASSNTWLQVATLTHWNGGSEYHSEHGFLSLTAEMPGYWWGMFGGMSVPELLFREPPPKGLTPSKWSVQAEDKMPMRWRREIPGHVLCLEDDRLWFLSDCPDLKVDAAGKFQFLPDSGGDFSLLRFQAPAKAPVKIPLQLSLEGIQRIMPKGVAEAFQNGQKLWKLTWTPEGLVVTRKSIPGFWLIPKAELDHALALNSPARKATISSKPE